MLDGKAELFGSSGCGVASAGPRQEAPALRLIAQSTVFRILDFPSFLVVTRVGPGEDNSLVLACPFFQPRWASDSDPIRLAHHVPSNKASSLAFRAVSSCAS